MFGLWISEEIVSNIKSAESYRPYEHYLIDSLQNVDPRVIDLKLYQGNWKQVNAQNTNYIGWLPVGNKESNKVRIIMSQPTYMAPTLFSSLIVAEMSADAEYPFAAIMQGSAFIYQGVRLWKLEFIPKIQAV